MLFTSLIPTPFQGYLRQRALLVVPLQGTRLAFAIVVDPLSMLRDMMSSCDITTRKCFSFSWKMECVTCTSIGTSASLWLGKHVTPL